MLFEPFGVLRLHALNLALYWRYSRLHIASTFLVLLGPIAASDGCDCDREHWRIFQVYRRHYITVGSETCIYVHVSAETPGVQKY